MHKLICCFQINLCKHNIKYNCTNNICIIVRQGQTVGNVISSNVAHTVGQGVLWSLPPSVLSLKKTQKNNQYVPLYNNVKGRG